MKKVQDAIDIQLLNDRKVFLWGMVNDESAKHVVDRLLYLDAQNNEEIQLFINSPGGYVTSGFSMYDTIKSIKSGAKGRRFIQPHARVMIHQPSGGARGQASDIQITAQEIVKTKELSAQILADNCGQTFEKIMKDFQRDHWMGAQESVDYGIVDGVYEG